MALPMPPAEAGTTKVNRTRVAAGAVQRRDMGVPRGRAQCLGGSIDPAPPLAKGRRCDFCRLNTSRGGTTRVFAPLPLSRTATPLIIFSFFISSRPFHSLTCELTLRFGLFGGVPGVLTTDLTACTA